MTLSSTGLVTLRLGEVRDAITVDLRGSLGAAAQLGSDTVLGKVRDGVSVQLALVHGLLQLLYDSFDPDHAEGEQLDNLASITGVTRLPATYTTTTLTITGTNGTVIASGKRYRVPNGPTFETTASATISGGTAQVAARAQTIGAVEAGVGTITGIVDVIAGVSAVTNAVAAVTGREVETDDELRARRELSLRIVGGGADQAIRARVLEVEGIDAAVVISNRTLVTDVNGIPGKSFRVIVWPAPVSGVPVWSAIWLTMPAGILSDGDEQAVAIDSQGNEQPVAYSVATERAIHIDVLITADTTEWPADGEAQARAAVLAAFADLSIGDDVRLFKITSAVAGIPGIITVAPRAKVGSAPGGGDTSNITISLTQIATFDSANIDITVTLV